MKNERFVLTVTRYYDEDGVEKQYQKIADTGNENDGKTKYGYVETSVTKKEKNIVVEQEFPADNIRAIIAAANGFKETT